MGEGEEVEKGVTGLDGGRHGGVGGWQVSWDFVGGRCKRWTDGWEVDGRDKEVIREERSKGEVGLFVLCKVFVIRRCRPDNGEWGNLAHNVVWRSILIGGRSRRRRRTKGGEIEKGREKTVRNSNQGLP